MATAIWGLVQYIADLWINLLALDALINGVPVLRTLVASDLPTCVRHYGVMLDDLASQRGISDESVATDMLASNTVLALVVTVLQDHCCVPEAFNTPLQVRNTKYEFTRWV